MNNLIKIQAMHYWVKTFGSTPAIEDYVNYYLDKVGLINVIENSFTFTCESLFAMSNTCFGKEAGS